MKKTFLFLAAFLTAIGMNLNAADPVSYLSPVYNSPGDPQSGVLRWDTLSCSSYTVVADASSQVTWNAGWYVVTGNVTLSQGAICNGIVYLILADGAMLTATNGIVVSGNANLLAIYGQSGQTGTLIATGGYYAAGIGGSNTSPGSNIVINGGNVTTTGGAEAAGIGGGYGGSGSYITINGGTVTATGGKKAAGIGGGYGGSGSFITINGGIVTATGDGDEFFAAGAGIGGGDENTGSNIIINGGTVTATGGPGASGIGKGYSNASPASDIYVDPSLILKADGTNPPTTVIAHASIIEDVASELAGKRYATVEPAGPDTLDYLHFVALKDGDTLMLNRTGYNRSTLDAQIEYSTDNRKSWTNYKWTRDESGVITTYGDTIVLNENDTIWFRAGQDGQPGVNAIFSKQMAVHKFVFGRDDAIAAYGNIMSLYDASLLQDTMTSFGFAALFEDCKALKHIPDMPINKLAANCFSGMYVRCTSLQIDTMGNVCDGTEISFPDNGVTTSWCWTMFQGCHGAYTAVTSELQLGGHYCVKEYTSSSAINQLPDAATPRFTKIVQNGQLLIIRDDKKFNAQGAVVK